MPKKALASKTQPKRRGANATGSQYGDHDSAAKRRDRAKRYGFLIARAWEDEDFKARLVEEPKAVFADFGIKIPAGIEVRVVENTPKLIYFILPPKPDIGDVALPIHVMDCPCSHSSDPPCSECWHGCSD